MKVAPKIEMEEMNRPGVLGAKAKEVVKPNSLSFHYVQKHLVMRELKINVLKI